MRPIFLVVYSFVFYTTVYGDSSDDNKRLRITILRHQPANSKPSPYESIRFPSIKDAPVKEDPSRGQGCYAISGVVDVLRPVKGTVQIYAEVKYGTNSPPETCRNPDKNNCGGAGSCCYCDVCGGLKNVTSRTRGLVRLESTNGNQLNCNEGLKPGRYTGLRLSFCSATKKEFLDGHHMDEQMWNDYVKGGRLVFITIYVFNEPINQLSTSAVRAIAIPNGPRVIACHRLVGTVGEY